MLSEVVNNYPRTGVTNNLLLDSQEFSVNIINVFPNPATNFINIAKEKKSENQPIFIYNLFGKIIYTGYNDVINSADFNDGLYLLKVANTYKKFIKQ